MNEAMVLMYDPFSGDFEGSGGSDRILRDKMVTARKWATCSICKESIMPGDRVRSRVEVYDGSLMTFKFCTLCCEAMESNDPDDALSMRQKDTAPAAGE